MLNGYHLFDKTRLEKGHQIHKSQNLRQNFKTVGFLPLYTYSIHSSQTEITLQNLVWLKNFTHLLTLQI